LSLFRLVGRRVVPLALLGVAVATVAGVWLIVLETPLGAVSPQAVNLALVLTIVIAVGFGILWFLINRLVIEGARVLAAETEMATHGAAGAHVNEKRFADLAPLPLAINVLSDQLATARKDIDRAVAQSTAEIAEQSSRLAAVLRDLHEGVIVCNLRHQILLYNQTAVTLLHWTGELGLGRSLFRVMLAEPIQHTLERLSLRLRDLQGKSGNGAEELVAPFIGGSRDGRTMLQSRMSLILRETGDQERPEVTGYVVTFSDATSELASLGQRDALLRQVTEGLRWPIANLRAMLETLADNPELAGEERRNFEQSMLGECNALSDRIEEISAAYKGAIAGSWPLSDLHSANVINLAILRIEAHSGHRITMTGLPHWFHGDSYTLVVLLDFLIERLHEATGLNSFDLCADAASQWVYLDIAWESDASLPAATVEGWKDLPLPSALGGLTVGDVLQRHHSDMWCEKAPHPQGYVHLRIPLPPPQEPPKPKDRTTIEARPDFFDFTLLEQPLPTTELREKRLRDLTYVVFDCETTGLRPSEGDELVAIAAVRIVNGRILTGETFNALINPGVAISQESIGVHGITWEMVKDRPKAEIVLPQFHAFCADAVLVAHNAAFDLKFLKLKEPRIGLKFTNPVIDTMLLSLMLQGEGADHTLDGIAARLGIEVVDRHIALGDALVTAAILLRMFDMLEARGIETLDDALRESNMLVELRQREQAF